METLKNVLIILGALAIPPAAIVIGFNYFYAGPGPQLGGCALLGALAVRFGFTKRFAAMGLYLAALLFLALVYPKLGGFESYMREGRMKGGLSELRTQVEKIKADSGAYPADASALLPGRLDLGPGHKKTAAVETVRLPAEAYLLPPAMKKGDSLLVTVKTVSGDWERRYSWSADSVWPVLLYPGRSYSYEVRNERDKSLVSGGTVSVPLPPGFVEDGATYVYDPGSGYVFINCTHALRQKPEAWWEF